MAQSCIATSLVIIACSFILHACWALPVGTTRTNSHSINDTGITEELFYDMPVDVHNVSFVPKDLIVIRTIIYEVGILTDADVNDTDDSPQIQDEINIRSFQPPKNTSVDWWKTFGRDSTQANAAAAAFEKVVPLGMTVLPVQHQQEEVDAVDGYDVISTTNEDSEESEEENAIELL